MKRVVIEERNDEIIPLSECYLRDNTYLGKRSDGFWGLVVEVTVGHLVFSTFRNDVPIDLVKFNNLADLIYGCAEHITFYQFPDFRSAMEYYLEQSK